MDHCFPEDMVRSLTSGEAADLHQGNALLFTLSAESRKDIDKLAQKVKKADGIVRPNEIE